MTSDDKLKAIVDFSKPYVAFLQSLDFDRVDTREALKRHQESVWWAQSAVTNAAAEKKDAPPAN